MTIEELREIASIREVVDYRCATLLHYARMHEQGKLSCRDFETIVVELAYKLIDDVRVYEEKP